MFKTSQPMLRKSTDFRIDVCHVLGAITVSIQLFKRPSWGLLVGVREIGQLSPFFFDLAKKRVEDSWRKMNLKMKLTAEGVKLASVLKTVPLLLSHRISDANPAPTS